MIIIIIIIIRNKNETEKSDDTVLKIPVVRLISIAL
jgi:hypothetical protein